MGDYYYLDSKKRVEDILNSKTKIITARTIPDDKSRLSFENGVRTWIGALFVDIRNSTEYFKNENSERVARIIRAFTSEIIGILEGNKAYLQIGIRGDCVYAIYNAPTVEAMNSIMTDAVYVNSFQKMFQAILRKRKWREFDIGIGLGASEDLVIKAGKRGTGINDNIWIGDAVIDASKLSGEGSKDRIGPIVMDECFYRNTKYFYKGHVNYISSFYSSKLGEMAYHCNLVIREINDWVIKEFY